MAFISSKISRILFQYYFPSITMSGIFFIASPYDSWGAVSSPLYCSSLSSSIPVCRWIHICRCFLWLLRFLLRLKGWLSFPYTVLGWIHLHFIGFFVFYFSVSTVSFLLFINWEARNLLNFCPLVCLLRLAYLIFFFFFN